MTVPDNCVSFYLLTEYGRLTLVNAESERKEAILMWIEMTKCMVGWFAMALTMGYFIWQEIRDTEPELEEDDEPPSTRLAFPVALF